MTGFNLVRDKVNDAMEAVADGWRFLWHKAKGAVTHFVPTTKSKGDDETFFQQWHSGTGWGLLPSDMYEDDKAVYVRLEVPGLVSKDLEIKVEGNTLYIVGHKKALREEKTDRFHLMECAYGSFERIFDLPCEVEHDQAKAECKHGILKVILPKASHKLSRVIHIS